MRIRIHSFGGVYLLSAVASLALAPANSASSCRILAWLSAFSFCRPLVFSLTNRRLPSKHPSKLRIIKQCTKQHVAFGRVVLLKYQHWHHITLKAYAETG